MAFGPQLVSLRTPPITAFSAPSVLALQPLVGGFQELTPIETSTLIPPYGGRLVNLMVPPEALDDLKAYANRLHSLQLAERSVCDLELPRIRQRRMPT